MVRRISLIIALVVASLALPGTAEARPKRKGKARKAARLQNGVKLPAIGPGYVIPQTWRSRGLSWGTPELVSMIKRAAKYVDQKQPGNVLFVGDLSYPKGGPSAWHRSHKTGTDVDLMFFATDGDGEPAPTPRDMVKFDDQGVGEDGRVFDVERNWLLVKALLADKARVRAIFVAEHLEELLLDHAAAIGERQALIDRAAFMLLQPSDSAPHDDHFHVRIDTPANRGKTKTKKPSRNARRAPRS